MAKSYPYHVAYLPASKAIMLAPASQQPHRIVSCIRKKFGIFKDPRYGSLSLTPNDKIDSYIQEIPGRKDDDLARCTFVAYISALLVRPFNEIMKPGFARDHPAITSSEVAQELRTMPESSEKYKIAGC